MARQYTYLVVAMGLVAGAGCIDLTSRPITVEDACDNIALRCFPEQTIDECINASMAAETPVNQSQIDCTLASLDCDSTKMCFFDNTDEHPNHHERAKLE